MTEENKPVAIGAALANECTRRRFTPSSADFREIVRVAKMELGIKTNKRGPRRRWADSSVYGPGATVKAVYKTAEVEGVLREWHPTRGAKGYAKVAIMGATITARVLAPED